MEQGAEVAVGGIGFTVGKEANYHFRLGAAAVAADTSAGYTEHIYDALGRLAAVAVYGNGKLLGDGVFEPDTLESLRLYVYDGWRLVSELDGMANNRVIAEYVPGPTYVDDVVAARRDQNRDGDFNDANEGFLYYLTDQQHSTVALLDGTGAVAERYGYDAFGAPSFHDGNGSPIAASAVGNDRLYTGRQWLPTLALYDYRQRLYDPAMGRFLTTDPVYDPANLGNPYTYVGNNPGAFVDPYGDLLETVWDAASLALGTASLGYNLHQGNYLSAGVDAVGVALDAVATAIPILPGGAGAGIRAFRATDIAFNAAQAAASGIDAGVAVYEGDYAGAAMAGTGAVLQGAHAGVRGRQVWSPQRGGTALEKAAEASPALRRMRAGQDFDKARASAYPHNEVYINGLKDRSFRLDSYNEELGEIVSRKFTQLAEVQEATAMKYIREIVRKYPRGAVIADVPSTRRMGLAGKKLEGAYYLEVPVQRGPVSQKVLDYAEKWDVTIRDVTGRTHP